MMTFLHHIADDFFWIFVGFALLGVVYLLFHGLPALWSAGSNVVSVASADVTQIKSVFSADLAWLESSVQALASHAGVTLPAKASAPAKPVVPPAPPAAPATPAAPAA